jgi:apolipoprotein D and lipocalin family protein
MKSILTLLLVFFLNANTFALDVVPQVDLYRYLGTWYEIAKYPNHFEKNCVFAKATYSILKPGVLHIDNQCIKADGRRMQALGKGYVVDERTNAKLKVQFFLKFLPISWLQGDYWVIKLDNNYQYAVVSDPLKKNLWILSRTPTMDEMTYQALLSWLTDQGFDTAKIIKNSPVNVDPKFFAQS